MLVSDRAALCIDACSVNYTTVQMAAGPASLYDGMCTLKSEPALAFAYGEACGVPASRGVPERCMRVPVQETKASAAQQGRHVEAPPVRPLHGPGRLLAIHPTQVRTLRQHSFTHTTMWRSHRLF